jgi:hypothetical protein
VDDVAYNQHAFMPDFENLIPNMNSLHHWCAKGKQKRTVADLLHYG